MHEAHCDLLIKVVEVLIDYVLQAFRITIKRLKKALLGPFKFTGNLSTVALCFWF